METILIILLLLPAAGLLVEKLGAGVKKENEFFLPGTTVPAIRPLLIHFSRNEGWMLIHEEQSDERSIYIFQKGKWGSSLQGVQNISITLFPKPDGVKVFIISRSRLGQMIDFNANQQNIESFGIFITDVLKHKDLKKRINDSADMFLRPGFIVNPKYWMVLIVVLLSVIAIKQLIHLTKVKVPGFVNVTFHERTPQDVMDKLLTEFGTVHCSPLSDEPDKEITFECEVPVGMEEDVSRSARRSPQVKDASPKYKE